MNEPVLASERYDAEVVRLGLHTRARNWLVTLLMAAGSEATVPAWRDRVRVIDRSTGEVVREVRNSTGDSFDFVSQVQADLAEFDVDQFEEAWGVDAASSLASTIEPFDARTQRGAEHLDER